MRKAFTRNDIIISAIAILVIGGLVLWAVLDTRRRSRDVSRVSDVRQVQSVLEGYRAANASYPGSLEDLEDLRVETPMAYAPEPEGCAPTAEAVCSSYRIDFALEGRVGLLPGGRCSATRESITCAP